MARRSTLIQRSRGKSAAEKAAYHQVTGAGSKKVKRPFFGLTREDEARIVRLVEAWQDRHLR